jgi:3',5'-nucleoside bisphosphate phosphatase
LIDLHTHTTASDGRLPPAELVARAIGAGVTVLAVTDHDTVGGCAAAAEACAAAGATFVPGIEITAVRDGVDVHVLGYFIDTASPAFITFLIQQRQQRIDRVRSMIELLARHGVHLDADAVLQPGLADATKAAGRPWIARALVAGGHVQTIGEAFDRWLSLGRPAFLPRAGVPPAQVFARVHDAGGIASLAHPGLLVRDAWIEDFAAGGLDAIEAYHSEQGPDATARYLTIADRLGLAVSGGSDYHGDDSHGASFPGAVSLPRERYERLVAVATRSRSG